MRRAYHKKTSKSHIAVPPGEEIKEQLEYRNISKREFAKMMGASERFVVDLLEGDVALTSEIAIKLEAIFGIDADFWSGFEELYRKDLAKVNEENKRSERAKRRWKYNNSSTRWGTLAVSHI